jgi:lysophospholipase L1-like esterase
MKNLSTIVTLTLLLAAFAYAADEAPKATEKAKNDPKKWEKDITAFEARDKANPPKKGQILFVGSSSIRLWKLEKSFPGVDAINRGFGGSMIEDSTYYVDRIVVPYEPRTIVFYAGDNDMAAGNSPEQAAADFAAFVKAVRAKLPKVKIVNVAIKPSIARWKNVENIRAANKLIQKQCEAGERMVFVDIDKPMMGEDGKPRQELFVQDGLHLSEKGYEIWDALVKRELD